MTLFDSALRDFTAALYMWYAFDLEGFRPLFDNFRGVV